MIPYTRSGVCLQKKPFQKLCQMIVPDNHTRLNEFTSGGVGAPASASHDAPRARVPPGNQDSA
jgi:hypothetical protein